MLSTAVLSEQSCRQPVPFLLFATYRTSDTIWPLEFPNYMQFRGNQERMLASLVTQLVKNPSAMQETPVQFLGQEDPLKKGKATHSSILAWRIPWIV